MNSGYSKLRKKKKKNVLMSLRIYDKNQFLRLGVETSNSLSHGSFKPWVVTDIITKEATSNGEVEEYKLLLRN